MADSANVLMVDDELVVLEAFVDILEDEGYTMFTAENGNAAVEILRANAIDVVVTDINMPGMDGLELLKVIREMDADLPVIMATAYSSIENTVESMKRGASNYLIKPIKIELLRSVLADAIATRRTLRQNRELTGELKHSNDELKKLNQERDRVLETIAQNLRQPLIDQMNWCELLTSDTERRLHTEHIELVGKANSAANKMLDQVNDLLDAERIEARARATTSSSDQVQDGESQEAEVPPGIQADAGAPETSAAPEAPAVAADEVLAPLDTGTDQNNRLDYKILLVESSSVLRDLLVRVLQRRFHVISAGDGWQALPLVAERPHLIVTELDLPNVDGVEMIRHARRISDDFAVLALCDARDKALLGAARSLGVSDTLLKPFEISELVARVEAFAEAAEPQIDNSVLIVSPHADEQYALYHLLDGRYRTQIATCEKDAGEAAVNDFDVAIIDVSAQEYSWEEVVTLIRAKSRYVKLLALLERGDAEDVGALRKAGVAAALERPYAVDDLLVRVRELLGIRPVEGRILRSVYRRVAV